MPKNASESSFQPFEMSECNYDCSENRTAQPIPDYADISGIGVVVGYTATAGLTVLIITGYYFFAHQPELDPFRSGDDDAQTCASYKPHPVDKLFLDLIRKATKRQVAELSEKSKRRTRLEKALLKCVLTMSDMQILTGLSILISGYSQLRCGLSVYHWQILVYLAWFCSLTHLSCLTFLRNHLYNHPGERLWRLIGMGALIIMLVVALLPTGNFGVSLDPADYAICAFRNLGPVGGDGTDLYDDSGLSYASMIISILFMTFGFFSRIVRLHRNLSIAVVAPCRAYLSECARRLLRKQHKRLEPTSASVSVSKIQMERMFIYRPALAVFLAARAVLDLWSSMILEVWWLMASFGWGLYNLVMSLGFYAAKPTSNKEWTFGQIAPVILLLAPLLSITEFMFEKPSSEDAPTSTPQTEEDTTEPEAPLRTETMELAANVITRSPESCHDDPDQDYYKEGWFQSVITLLLCGVISSTIQILFVSSLNTLNDSSKLSKGQQLVFFIPNSVIISWFPFVFLLGLMNIILFSLLWKDSGYKFSIIKVILWLGTLLVYFIISFLSDLGYLFGFAAFGGLYVVLSFFYVTRAKIAS